MSDPTDSTPAAGDDTTPTTIAIDSIIKSTYAHYIIFGCAIFACAWAGFCAFRVSKIEITEDGVIPSEEADEIKVEGECTIMDQLKPPTTAKDCFAHMVNTN